MNNIKNIRNFVIISHIDHGKSTLADRFLELTGTVAKEKMRPQFLDAMDLERGRGITIKMHPVRMEYEGYVLNLIDTPGHVDFSYEVSRSLAAVEGAVLLVDATKGIQAQTIANLELAKKQNLIIIPVINKIDLIQARAGLVKEELAELLKVKKEEIFEISAKIGTNVNLLLRAIIEKVPPPKIEKNDLFRALIFDSKYDSFKGIIAYVRVIEGEVKVNDRVYMVQNKISSEVKEVGYFKPDFLAQGKLGAGEIGYLATGIKELGKVRVGDTITLEKFKTKVSALAGYQEPKPMVFASIYPGKSEDFDLLKQAVLKLKLNDAAFVFETEQREFLGRGFRCGFLGTLHGEIVFERLQREFGLNLIISSPSVVYKIRDKKGKEYSIFSASDWLPKDQIEEVLEPWVKLEVLVPPIFLGVILEFLKKRKGKLIESNYFTADKMILNYEIPLREIISGFYEQIKSLSQGFASINYEFLEYRKGDLVKLEIFIGGQKEEAFSKIVPRLEAFNEGKKIVEKLKEIFPPQLFSLPLQAAAEGRIIARETIKAKRRDVIAPLYGGDYTRKRKLLEKQKKGKKELKEKTKIIVPPKVFLEMIKS